MFLRVPIVPSTAVINVPPDRDHHTPDPDPNPALMQIVSSSARVTVAWRNQGAWRHSYQASHAQVNCMTMLVV